jgi:hypothetical protein
MQRGARIAVQKVIEICWRGSGNALYEMRDQYAAGFSPWFPSTKGLSRVRILSLGMSRLQNSDHAQKAVQAKVAPQPGIERQLESSASGALSPQKPECPRQGRTDPCCGLIVPLPIPACTRSRRTSPSRI